MTNHTTPAAGPAVCCTCNTTAHLKLSPTTGNVLAVDDPDDLDSIHRCVLGNSTVVVTVDTTAGTGVAVPLNGAGNALGHVLGGVTSGTAEWADGAVRRLTRRGFTVLRRGETPPGLFDGGVSGG